MRIVYVADDGAEFDDEFECEAYEWKIKHPNLNDITFYDVNNNMLSNLFDEETYYNTEKIHIPNNLAAKDLLEFAKYTGFCAYSSITSHGIWVFDSHKSKFVKI